MRLLLQRLRTAKHSDGFTLIELLVVIIIIGILLAVAVPSYLGFKGRADTSAAKANVRAAVPAVEAFYSDHGTYSGMTNAELALIDPASAAKVTVGPVAGQTGSSYCIQNTSPTTPTYRKIGPGGDIQAGSCP